MIPVGDDSSSIRGRFEAMADLEQTARDPMSVGYLVTVLSFMGVLPVASVVVECLLMQTQASTWDSAFRWFVFWGVGLRLLAAGVRQIVQPAFTAREIFQLSSPDAEVIVRELGFANVCMGLGAVVAGFVAAFRPCAALVGGLYFGIAGVMHVVKKPATPNEWVALVSDLFIFAIMAACLLRWVF